MKRLNALLVAACLLTAGIQYLPVQQIMTASAADYTTEVGTDGLKYYVYEDHAEVYGTTLENTTHLVIPDGFEKADGVTVPVTVIRSTSFWNTDIEKLTIASTVTTIKSQAFNACSSLTEIEFSAGEAHLETIESSAFRGCKALQAVTFPPTLQSIGVTAFDNDISLQSVVFQDSNNENGLTIEKNAFDGCTALTELKFAEGLKNIGYWAFENCTALEEVTFPTTLQSINSQAFRTDTSLKKITFLGGDNLIIGSGAFMECSSLETIIMGEGVAEIQDSAFKGLKSLKIVQLSPTLKTIGTNAFSYCSELTEIEIPSSVETIGGYAFHMCQNLTDVKLNEGLKEIKEYAFYLCTALTDVTIPSTVETIGNSIFYDARGLTSVTFLGMNTPMDKWRIQSTAIIRGYEGSTAQELAEANGYTFELIGSEPDVVVYGDVNTDGTVDIMDIILLNKAIFGKVTLTTNAQQQAADVDKNGEIDATDSLMIMKYIVKLIDTLG